MKKILCMLMVVLGIILILGSLSYEMLTIEEGEHSSFNFRISVLGGLILIILGLLFEPKELEGEGGKG